MNDASLYMVILLAGFFPTYAWRVAAVLALSHIDPASPLLLWVRSVASALVAALVMRLVLASPGALAHTHIAIKIAALMLAVLCFYVLRRYRSAGAVAVGSAVILILNF